MSFDWANFLDRRRIAYSSKGASGDNVRIGCPWCHSADSMSVSLVGDGWRCWRQPGEHYGRNPAKLVQALINCSWQEACSITGQVAGISGDDVLSKVNSLFKKPEPRVNLPLILPPEFQSFQHELPSSQLFTDYLEHKRGFARSTIKALTEDYGIRYCMRGAFSGRIIFPILHDAQMVTWTGRSIYAVEELRYKALSSDPERAKEEGLPPAVKPITEYLWNYDQLKTDNDPSCLVLTEGPFDALKVDVLGRGRGIAATCFFTMTASPQQIELLHDVLPRFRYRILLLDQNTTSAGLRLTWQLQTLGVVMRQLPRQFKDPGELKTPADLSCVLNLDALQHHG
jgi:hypothetical protein